MKKGTLKQILLMTDGCSNSGENPVKVAKSAFKQGITVNVIGILEHHENEMNHGLKEVEEIAKAGGGISQIVYKEDLSQTVQSVTRQAMTETLQGFVNQELAHIFGEERTLEEVEPDKRGEIVEVVEDLGEKCDLEVCILVDTSASMGNKLTTVQEALIDLSINLHARSGNNAFTIYQFPHRKKPIERVQDWASRLDSFATIFPKLVSGGLTPTGPAIREAMVAFSKNQLREDLYEEERFMEREG